MILINPKFNRIEKLGIFSRYVPISLPISLGTLAGNLIAHGKQAKILDDQITTINEQVLNESVKDMSRPYIFGLSCYTAGVGRGYEISKLIKNLYQDSYVVMGGIHPTVMPDEVLSHNEVDIVMRREADETIITLYDALKLGHDYRDIGGISFRDENNNIVHNHDAPVLADLDSLPPYPYHLFEEHIDKYSLGFILSSRGCPYNCIFCSQIRISGRNYRATSPDRVIEELDILINKHKQTNISFFDDNFVVNGERTKNVCNLIYENGFHKKAVFSCQTRGDAIDEEILHYFKKANFQAVSFGLETGSDNLMKLINKNEVVADNIRAVKLVKKFGLKVGGSFIFGLPTESRKERVLGMKLAKDLDLDYARFNNATPYPGTELYNIAVREGRLNAGKNWDNLSAVGTFVEGPFNRAPLAYCPETSTEKELRQDILRANFFFWLRPKMVFRLLKERSVSGGWFYLPPKWYLNPKEWFNILRLGFRVIFSFLKIFI